jgi:hypothetical protein
MVGGKEHYQKQYYKWYMKNPNFKTSLRAPLIQRICIGIV